MTGLMDWIKARRESHINETIRRERRSAVNVLEHGGELWICHFGEPVVPLRLVGDSSIESLMNECRKGWESYVREQGR